MGGGRGEGWRWAGPNGIAPIAAPLIAWCKGVSPSTWRPIEKKKLVLFFGVSLNVPLLFLFCRFHSILSSTPLPPCAALQPSERFLAFPVPPPVADQSDFFESARSGVCVCVCVNAFSFSFGPRY